MRDEREHTRRASELLAGIATLSPGAWAAAPRAERVQALQKAEDGVAALDRRPPAAVDVVSGEAPAFVAAYRRRDNRIFMADATLDAPSPREATRAILHAGRYAYQYAIVEDPARHAEMDPRALAGLLANWNHYIYPAPGLEGRYDRVYFRRP